jgi:hypothetical protein
LSDSFVPNSRVENAVESICNRGCRYVNSILSSSEIQQDCLELKALDSSEQQVVIEQLSSVMAVYDQTGSCDI